MGQSTGPAIFASSGRALGSRHRKAPTTKYLPGKATFVGGEMKGAQNIAVARGDEKPGETGIAKKNEKVCKLLNLKNFYFLHKNVFFSKVNNYSILQKISPMETPNKKSRVLPGAGASLKTVPYPRIALRGDNILPEGSNGNHRHQPIRSV